MPALLSLWKLNVVVPPPLATEFGASLGIMQHLSPKNMNSFPPPNAVEIKCNGSFRRRSIATVTAASPAQSIFSDKEKRHVRLSLAALPSASFSSLSSPRYERTKRRVRSEVQEARRLSQCIKDQLAEFAELSSPITVTIPKEDEMTTDAAEISVQEPKEEDETHISLEMEVQGEDSNVIASVTVPCSTPDPSAVPMKGESYHSLSTEETGSVPVEKESHTSKHDAVSTPSPTEQVVVEQHSDLQPLSPESVEPTSAKQLEKRIPQVLDSVLAVAQTSHDHADDKFEDAMASIIEENGHLDHQVIQNTIDDEGAETDIPTAVPEMKDDKEYGDDEECAKEDELHVDMEQLRKIIYSLQDDIRVDREIISGLEEQLANERASRSTYEENLRTSLESQLETSLQLAMTAMVQSFRKECEQHIAKEVQSRLAGIEDSKSARYEVEYKPAVTNSDCGVLALDMSTAAVRRLTNDKLRNLLEAVSPAADGSKPETTGNKSMLVRRVLSWYRTNDVR